MNAAKELRRLRAAWARGARMVPRSVKAKGCRKGQHNRWHVKRGIVNPKCEFCRAKKLS